MINVIVLYPFRDASNGMNYAVGDEITVESEKVDSLVAMELVKVIADATPAKVTRRKKA